MPTRPIFDTAAVVVILKKMQNNIGLSMPWDNLCYCLLEAAWRTIADLVRYLCLLKSVILVRKFGPTPLLSRFTDGRGPCTTQKEVV